MGKHKPIINEQFQTYIIDYGLSHNIFKKRVEDLLDGGEAPNNESQHIENTVYEDPFFHFKGNMLFSSKNGFTG